VPRGTVKRLRVAAIESRPTYLYRGYMGCPTDDAFKPFITHWGDSSGEAVTLGGAWDIKHVLGEVPVEEDGSCAFECPADTGVYFQLLDAKGRTVQTMRSWAMLRPGETQSCQGCHENKLQAYPSSSRATAAVNVRRLESAAGLPPHPLLERLRTQGLLASPANYLGVNAARTVDPEAPTEGFSFPHLVQPILDRHCVKCHDGVGDRAKRPNLTGNWKRYRVEGGRRFSEAYVALTRGGRQTELVNWYSATGRPQMLPPYAQGSGRSGLTKMLEKGHRGVTLSDAEQRVIACWIDLGVPFGGSYSEKTTWNEDDRRIFDYHQNKRMAFAAREIEEIRKELGK